MFRCSLRFLFYVFSPENNQYVFKCLLMMFMFLNVCSAPFRSKEWKWLNFICSVITGCIFIIVWNRSSRSLNFSLLPSNVMGVVVTGLVVIDFGLFWRLTENLQGCLRQLRFWGWQSRVQRNVLVRLLSPKFRVWVDSSSRAFMNLPLGVGSSCHHVRTTVSRGS